MLKEKLKHARCLCIYVESVSSSMNEHNLSEASTFEPTLPLSTTIASRILWKKTAQNIPPIVAWLNQISHEATRGKEVWPLSIRETIFTTHVDITFNRSVFRRLCGIIVDVHATTQKCLQHSAVAVPNGSRGASVYRLASHDTDSHQIKASS